MKPSSRDRAAAIASCGFVFILSSPLVAVLSLRMRYTPPSAPWATIFVVQIGIPLGLGLLSARQAAKQSIKKRRRELQGLCKRCNYDLRGLPERRCSECGTPF